MTGENAAAPRGRGAGRGRPGAEAEVARGAGGHADLRWEWTSDLPRALVILSAGSLAGSIAVMTYTQPCPRCGSDIRGDDMEVVADGVVEHARAEHDHTLDRRIVLAHLEGVHPYEREE